MHSFMELLNTILGSHEATGGGYDIESIILKGSFSGNLILIQERNLRNCCQLDRTPG